MGRSAICARLARAAALIAIVAVMAGAPCLATAAGAGSVTPAEALQQLLDGNTRYVANKATHPDSRPSDATQHPSAVVLSCSDSRVPPEILFDRGVGTLFIVRAAGNTCGRLALDSIEYAVLKLATPLIVVMGHDRCGAVQAAVANYPKPAGPMLENIYPAVEKTRGQPGDPVANAISENALLTAQRLSNDPKLAPLIANGHLKIVAARYNLATGAVTLLPSK